MTTALKLRRGTTAQHASFTGAAGEVTVDTTKKTAVVHDGSTAGGFPLLKEANPSYTGTLTGGTGVVNIGSGQIYKDASGNVGIGTSSPSIYANGKLVVAATSSAPADIVMPRAGLSSVTQPTSYSGADEGRFSFYQGDAGVGYQRYLDIVANGAAGTANANIRLYTSNSGSAPVERMRIDGSGNVGIGTDSPNSPAGSTQKTLHIHNSATGSSPGLHLTNGDSGANGGDGSLIFMGNAAGTGTTSLNLYNQEAGPIVFYTGTTDRGRFDASGNFLFNSGYGSAAVAYGCRAWVNFNGTGTVAIRASGNVSSITDNGTGNYTVNFTTAMPDANYAFSGNIGYNNATGGASNRTCQTETGSLTTSSIRVLTGVASVSTLEDQNAVFVKIFR